MEEAFNAFFFFPSIFNSNDRSWAAQTSELEDHDQGSSNIPSVVTEIVRDHLYQCNIHIHGVWQDSPQSADGIGDSYSWTPLKHLPKVVKSSEVPADQKLASVIPIYEKGMRKDPGHC